jgi:hypothetical protein
MKNATMTDRPPILGDLSKRQAVVLREYIGYLDELLDYALSCAGDMNKSILYGFTSRIEALRDDLVDELPPGPRIIPFVRDPAFD